MACLISLIDASKEKVVETRTVDENYVNTEKYVEQLNEKLNKKPNRKGLFWKVTLINC